MNLKFTKMHGLGNDFVVINGMNQPLLLSPEQICHIADRHTGIGCDQVLLLEASTDPAIDVIYRIYNADGSEAGQCGNGARCVGQYLVDNGIVDKPVIHAETIRGRVQIYIEQNNTIRVNMGVPAFEPDAIPIRSDNRQASYSIDLDQARVQVMALSMGNPHAVMFVDDIDTAEVEKLGPAIQQLPLFPESVNVGFLQIVDRTHARLRVYERGAGETLACGTGTCAAVVAGILHGKLDNDVVVTLKKGNLLISWQGEGSDVWMSGPAITVFEGQIEL
jgi:diaminopimelate epimerase